MLRLARLIAQAGICSNTGAIAGAFVGMVFDFMLVGAGLGHLPWFTAAFCGMGISICAWLAIFLVLVTACRLRASVVMLPSLATCAVSGILTALTLDALGRTWLAMLIGWAIGLAVGRAFCLSCSVRAK